MYITFFFADLIPLRVAFSLLHMFLCYWVEKYRLLRRIKIPIQMGGELIRGAVGDLNWLIVLYIVIQPILQKYLLLILDS